MEPNDYERPALMGGVIFGVTCSLGALVWQFFLGFGFSVLLSACISAFLVGSISGPVMFEKVRRGGFVFGLGQTFCMGVLIYVILLVWPMIWYDQSNSFVGLGTGHRFVLGFLGQALFVSLATMLLALPFGVAAGAIMTRWAENVIEYQRVNSISSFDEHYPTNNSPSE